ncbi:GNAT family N-acetyltransferase [Haladaptatus sp. DYF46]|uniref:GNAT family N-acetyltransferase n=1 Tax=Haladaptatus sp. DYF46 TaxID=2886041 RepID=UPI001E3C75C4|nr:GNAT family N-acetyltransferase [Haladaptatus sp. DYF46]
MKLHEPTSNDAERIHELARSAMTTSYSLSPQQIENVVNEEFSDDRLANVLTRSDAYVFALEDEDFETLVGFIEGYLDGDTGEIRWILIDPEHRGKGVGKELLETAVEKLREDDAERIHVKILEANREGSEFLDEFNIAKTGSQQVEYGGESFIEDQYTLDATEREAVDDESEEELEPTEVALENTNTHDGTLSATTDDGETVYLNMGEAKSGTENPFFVTYTDEAFTEQFGYFCGNCGSLDTTRDAQDHIECPECGNVHTPKSAESYDDSYL